MIALADVQPLRGLRYAVGDAIDNLAKVVTPPYDVISEEQQTAYYARNPYNIIRLELGQEKAQDNTLNNRYTRAAATFADWRLHGIIKQEVAPSYYLYQQQFTHNGHSYTRTSLLARVRLEPWSARVVLPHEHTLSKPKDDRLKLLRACATNLSPIMSLYDDPQGRIRKLLGSYVTGAEVEFTDEVGELHRLHPISDPDVVASIQDFFSERQLYIADGHHRYEMALNYQAEMREQRKYIEPSDAVNFVLMSLIDIEDPGIVVFPTHRLLFGLSQPSLSALSSEQLARYFTVQELKTPVGDTTTLLKQLAETGEQQPSLVISTAHKTLLLSLNEQGRARMTSSGHSDAWNELDVAIAHTLILEELLGLNAEDMSSGKHIRFTRDTQEALQTVQAGGAQAALILNATRVRQICNVALADDRMPQKSTYFYPKLITGLVMNPLW